MQRWLTPFDDSSHALLRAALLRRALALFGLLLMAATWRLWTPQTVFPQVPLFGWAVGTPAWCQWLGAAGMVAGLAGMLVAPQGRMARGSLVAFAVATVAMFVLDQQRMQPWAYQFVLLAVVLAATPPRPALALLRLFIISFYCYSAVTKLDNSFLHTLGQQFLEALLGARVETWSEEARLALAAVFPLGELLVAAGLALRRTRRMALAGAVSLHVLLLVILGPWGLGHKPGVLLWNAYFIVQDLLLFAVPRRLPAADEGTATQRAPWPVVTVVLAAVGLPLLEPTSWFDMWPSWGLYASSAERVVFQVHRLGRVNLPPALEPFVEVPDDAADPWLTVRLDRWALASLSAPIYPQNRVQLGVAAAVIEHERLANRARVIRLGLANRFSGAREQTLLQGPAQLAAAHDDYLLNSRPKDNLRP